MVLKLKIKRKIDNRKLGGRSIMLLSKIARNSNVIVGLYFEYGRRPNYNIPQITSSHWMLSVPLFLHHHSLVHSFSFLAKKVDIGMHNKITRVV